MSSRAIWSTGGSEKVQDLICSFCAVLLLGDSRKDPLYLCSPYLSDFRLVDNSFGEFGALISGIPELADKQHLLFTDVLRELSSLIEVRIVTVRHPSSMGFAERILSPRNPRIKLRFNHDAFHEKGLLSNDFYIEGSMNFTFSGVYVRDEKVVCHTPDDQGGRGKIDEAFLQFDRLWRNLGEAQEQGGFR